ncbi:MAG: hypothetical protein MZV63_05920 [Marinilabiliales bacterium]|nr:hypothetical protein [Marinilabiliales bacterium]
MAKKVVKAKVTKGNSGDEEKYKLHFKIISQSNPQDQTFKIDPVLKNTLKIKGFIKP